MAGTSDGDGALLHCLKGRADWACAVVARLISSREDELCEDGDPVGNSSCLPPCSSSTRSVVPVMSEGIMSGCELDTLVSEIECFG